MSRPDEALDLDLESKGVEATDEENTLEVVKEEADAGLSSPELDLMFIGELPLLFPIPRKKRNYRQNHGTLVRDMPSLSTV